MFVSALQEQGVEVAVVAQLAGHTNPSVTLGHCMQEVRGGEGAAKALEATYR